MLQNRQRSPEDVLVLVERNVDNLGSFFPESLLNLFERETRLVTWPRRGGDADICSPSLLEEHPQLILNLENKLVALKHKIFAEGPSSESILITKGIIHFLGVLGGFDEAELIITHYENFPHDCRADAIRALSSIGGRRVSRFLAQILQKQYEDPELQDLSQLAEQSLIDLYFLSNPSDMPSIFSYKEIVQRFVNSYTRPRTSIHEPNSFSPLSDVLAIFDHDDRGLGEQLRRILKRMSSL